MLKIFRKSKLPEGITESKFECQRDDLTIRGTELRPEGEKLPIAIVSHGFMATQDTVKQYARALAELGYAAYIFDFNGGCVVNGKSDGKTTEMSVLTEVKDLESVIDYVTKLPYVNRDRLLLMGGSQGGFVSALTAAKLKEQVEKLVLLFPALCIPDDARAGHMMFAKFDPENIPERIQCGPMKLGRCYVADVIGMGPYEEIAPYPGRVCIIHGSADTLVRPEYSKRAFETYRNSTPEGMSPEDRVQLHIIEGGGHGFSPKHDKEAIEILKEFAR